MFFFFLRNIPDENNLIHRDFLLESESDLSHWFSQKATIANKSRRGAAHEAMAIKKHINE